MLGWKRPLYVNSTAPVVGLGDPAGFVELRVTRLPPPNPLTIVTLVPMTVEPLNVKSADPPAFVAVSVNSRPACAGAAAMANEAPAIRTAANEIRLGFMGTASRDTPRYGTRRMVRRCPIAAIDRKSTRLNSSHS